ncbi:hypothetical protein pb186bvf_020795 [Paramecium bursaria]
MNYECLQTIADRNTYLQIQINLGEKDFYYLKRRLMDQQILLQLKKFTIKPNTRQMLYIQQSKLQSFNTEKVKELIQNDKQLLKRKKKKSFDETTSDTLTNHNIGNNQQKMLVECQAQAKNFHILQEYIKPLGNIKDDNIQIYKELKLQMIHKNNNNSMEYLERLFNKNLLHKKGEQFSDRWKNIPKMYDQLFEQKPIDYESQDSQQSTSKQIQHIKISEEKR